MGSDESGRWPEGLIRGMSFASWRPDGYATEATVESLRELAEAGASDVAFVVTWYVDDATDSDPRPHPNRTPTEGSVRAALEAARRLGLSTSLKPHVDVLDGTYRGAIRPADVPGWFRSYGRLVTSMAEISRETGCTLLSVGTELDSMTEHGDEWLRTLAEARSAFDGPLVYGANWTDLESEATLSLAREVDLFGVDAYFPVAESHEATVDEMAGAWEGWLDVLDAVRRSVGRPMVLTELGCASRRGGPVSPWDWQSDEPADLEGQARYYRAALRALARREGIGGAFFWAWGPEPAGAEDRSHNPRGKPAAEELRRAWQR